MEQKNKYSNQKLQKFKENIQQKLDKMKKELRVLQRNQLDQKKFIDQANMSFSDDSRRFQNRAMLDRMVTRLKKKLSALEAALTRVEQGTYGICKKTGNLISEQRLLAMPTAILSISAKRRQRI